MADDLGERTEQATPRRRQEARDEGNVARSVDLAASLMLLVATVAVGALSLPMLGQGTAVLRQVLEGAVGDPLVPGSVMELVAHLSRAAMRILLPILGIAWIAGYLVHLLQVGWIFSFKTIQPKLSKLDPISGMRRIFGLSALVKAALDSLKVVVAISLAALTVMQRKDEIVLLPYLEPLECLARIGWLVLDLALRVLALLLILGILDLVYQRWKHNEDLKMTKQQVKDEMKQTEGDPETKKRRLRMQQQIAMQRISAAVPKADVVVTNPEHVAVAIQYDADRMGAPRVVAKGADHLAARIRQIALRERIPIVERKPLARALYRQVPVGGEIPPELYKAVAEILAYVYRLSGKAA